MSVLAAVLTRAAGLRPATARGLVVDRDVGVRAADGAMLLTDLYRPRGGGRLPTVLMRTPYGRHSLWSAMAEIFARRGYNAVLQSCGGTFGSGGRLDFQREAADGRATADWIVQQPWSNGEIGTFGPSYLSLVQWALASTAPPQLKAMAIQIMSSDRRRSSYPGGSFALDTALTWTYLVGHQELKGLAWMRAGLRRRRALETAFGHLPLMDADVVAIGREAPPYRQWLRHDQPGDPYWEPVTFSRILPTLGIPVSLVGGWYDYYLPYMLEDYASLARAGSPVQLVVGPWAHRSFGGISAGLRHAMDWLDAHLLGHRDRPSTARVRVAVMGGGWRDLPSWPPTATVTPWYLQPERRLARSSPPDSPPDRYRYDPADPTPSVGGTTLSANSGPKDNRRLEARGDVLTYTTEALDADLEVAGPVAADVFVSSSLQHTDCFVRLCDVKPRGRSTNVCDGLLRLRPGEPARSEDGSARVRVELWPTVYRFRRGHRIRLQVSSGAHPRFARNTGSGESLATATSLVAADQAVHHDPAHPSAILLPVVSP